MQRKAQQEMEEFKMKAKEMDQQGNGFLLYLYQCASQDCRVGGSEILIPECVNERDSCRVTLQNLLETVTEAPGRRRPDY